jgi:hypothetical protein
MSIHIDLSVFIPWLKFILYLYDLSVISFKQNNSVAFSLQVNYTDLLSDRHLLAKLSANFCG